VFTNILELMKQPGTEAGGQRPRQPFEQLFHFNRYGNPFPRARRRWSRSSIATACSRIRPRCPARRRARVPEEGPRSAGARIRHRKVRPGAIAPARREPARAAPDCLAQPPSVRVAGDTRLIGSTSRSACWSRHSPRGASPA
jgi:hypothetical protein